VGFRRVDGAARENAAPDAPRWDPVFPEGVIRRSTEKVGRFLGKNRSQAFDHGSGEPLITYFESRHGCAQCRRLPARAAS